MINALALDLGTSTGFTYNDPYDGIVCGTWKLASAKEIKEWGQLRITRRRDPRVLRLFDLVSALHERLRFNVIVFEDVQFASSTYQVQLWSSFRAAVWLACKAVTPIPYFDCVPVGTLKAFATGSGAATKTAMLAAAKRKKLLDDSAEFDDLDDNAIDALHLFDWAQKNLSRMRTNEQQ